jgi:uncharacterized membrane protein YeaQ/YmgE (transglycosylase-associated protein family)
MSHPLRASLNALLLTLLTGAVASWFARQLLQGTGFGLLGDIFVGIVGALVAAGIFPTLGLNPVEASSPR